MGGQKLMEVSTVVDATPDQVWAVLIDPETVRQYMYGAELTTTWEEGAAIRWTGVLAGKRYENRGTVLTFDPPKTLVYTYWSSISLLPDTPENYVTVTNSLTKDESGTRVTVSIEGKPVAWETERHMEWGWNWILLDLKTLVEARAQGVGGRRP